MQKTFCDMCKGEIHEKHHAIITLEPFVIEECFGDSISVNITGGKFDLCDTCREKILDFIQTNGGENAKHNS